MTRDMKNNSGSHPIDARLTKLESVSDVGDFQQLANKARNRLAQRPVEAERQRDPDAILELSTSLNPVHRYMNGRDARPAAMKRYWVKMRRTRDLLIEAGMDKKFAGLAVEQFPWHCVDEERALAFAQLLSVQYGNRRSRDNLLGILRQLLRECVVGDLISATQRDRVLECLPVKNRPRARAGRELTDDEIVRLLTVGINPKMARDLRDRAIVAVFLSTGIRASEIAEIDVKDLDLDDEIRSVQIRRTKSGTSREVWLTPSALTFVKAWLIVRGDHAGALFDSSTRRGLPMTAEHMTALIHERGKRAGVKKNFTSHDMRRTFATRALRMGADPFTVQRLLAHKNVQTTLIYDRRTDLEDRAIVEILDLPGLADRNGDATS